MRRNCIKMLFLGVTVSKKSDAKDSASSKQGSQDSGSKRSQDDSGNRKRGSEESKRGSQSRSPIEESPEHVTCDIYEETIETVNSSLKRVRFLSRSQKPCSDKGIEKLKTGSPPIKKTTTVILTVHVESGQEPPCTKNEDNIVSNDRQQKEVAKITNEGGKLFLYL